MSYVKNYDVGNVRIDAPYMHIVHELPLLSFGDVQHTIGLSLVFRSRLMNNAYYVSEGYKLNLHKRLVLTPEEIPACLEDGDGAIYPLECYGDIFMFQDGSQRIVRKLADATFELEYPDFSKERYNGNGYIISVHDKYGDEYMTYQYVSSNKWILLLIVIGLLNLLMTTPLGDWHLFDIFMQAISSVRPMLTISERRALRFVTIREWSIISLMLITNLMYILVVVATFFPIIFLKC